MHNTQFLKSLSLTSLALLCTYWCVQAQIPSKPTYIVPHIKELPESAQPRTKLSTIGHKAAGLDSRLIATSYRPQDGSGGYTLLPSDTSTYFYSGIRGGDLSGFRPLLFDSSYTLAYDATSKVFLPTGRNIQHFDASSRLITQLSDHNNWAQWIPIHWYSWLRDVAGRDSVYTERYQYKGRWEEWNRNRRFYSSTGQLLLLQRETHDHVRDTLKLDSRDTFIYTTNGLVSAVHHYVWHDTSSTWRQSGAELLSYNSFGLLSAYYDLFALIPGTALDTLHCQKYYYNAAGHLTDVYSRNYQHGNIDSTHHAPLNGMGLPLISSSYEWNGASWDTGIRYQYTYTPSGLTATSMSESYYAGVFAGVYRSFYDYNTYDQITRHRNETFFNNSWIPYYSNSDSRFYYQLYDDLAISTTMKLDMPIKLSPIPAQDALYLDMNLPTGTVYFISVLNSEGRIQMQSSGISSGAIQQRIETAILPAGLYSLSVHTPKGTISKTFIIRH